MVKNLNDPKNAIIFTFTLLGGIMFFLYFLLFGSLGFGGISIIGLLFYVGIISLVLMFLPQYLKIVSSILLIEGIFVWIFINTPAFSLVNTFMIVLNSALIVFAFLTYLNYRSILNLPTSKIGSAAIGKVELVGITKAFKRSFTAPFSGKDSVFYELNPAKFFHTGTKTDHVLKSVPFILKDNTGEILIIPPKGDFDSVLFVKPKFGSIEEYIPVDHKLYVVGDITINDDPKTKKQFPTIIKGGSPFILSVKPEKELVKITKLNYFILIAGALSMNLFLAWIGGLI